ncbi:hypothetical protein [Desulfobacula sp.]|uniref:hypothetical protein n=1 Tax=Desulfobacula sp. TaxID=2593537 RepID=UPI0039B87E81
MEMLKSKAIIIFFMVITAIYVTGCASSRSGQVYSRDHARQVQTVEDGIVEFKNNNLSVLTSIIFNVEDMEKDKISELLTQAEAHSKNNEITDQNKYLVDQKIDVLKTLN